MSSAFSQQLVEFSSFFPFSANIRVNKLLHSLSKNDYFENNYFWSTETLQLKYILNRLLLRICPNYYKVIKNLTEIILPNDEIACISALRCLSFKENHSFSQNFKLRPKQTEHSPIVTLLQIVIYHNQVLRSFI